MMKKIYALLIILVCIYPFSGFAEVLERPSFAGYVYDSADVLSSSDEFMMAAYAESVNTSGIAQVVIVTVDSLNGMKIEDYCTELFNAWGIGRYGKNDGLLILLAPNERQVYIAPGSGIGSQVTSEEWGKILDKYAVPQLKENQFSTGMLSLTKAVCLKITLERSPLFDDSNMIQDLLEN